MRAQRERLRDFLRGADLVKFAAHQPSADEVSAALDAAGGFLDKTRTAAPDPELQRAAEPPRA